MASSRSKRVAIVGGGFTGIAAFWALQNSCHDVHLFEASPTLGGHIKTLSFENNGDQVAVDMGLPLFNRKACPNLASLLHHFGMPTTAVRFSFGVSDGSCDVKWHTSILKSIIFCPGVLLKKETYRLLLDIVSLRYLSIDVLAKESLASHPPDSQYLTDNYLSEKGYSDRFRDMYLAPLMSMLWGTNAGRFFPRFPVEALIRCLSDHQLIYPTGKMTQKWNRIDLGIRHLIEKMTRLFPRDKLHFQTKVNEIRRYSKSQYGLMTSDGKQSLFDHVILTVDGQEILRILGSTVSVDEKEILQCLGVTKNIAILHSDYSPNTRYAALGYNYIMPSHDQRPRDPTPPISCLKYNINIIQDLPVSRFGRVLITLNPLSPPHPSLVQGVWEFTEPEPSATSLHAQARLSSIQNKRGLSYGFCWTGRGPLEDALTSGLRIAIEDLGAEVPFPVCFHPHPLDCTGIPSRRLRIKDHLVRTVTLALRLFVLVLEIILILLGRLHTPRAAVRARLNVARAWRRS